MRKSPLWLRLVVLVGLVWALVVLIAATISEPTPENITYLVSIPGSGLYTLLLYLLRLLWLPAAIKRPLRSAMIIGIFNAAAIEILFWAVERVLGAHGVAASENLLLDLVVTMPWYIGMMILFVGGQNRQRFSIPMLLLLAGLYELGADGIVGGLIIPLVSSTPVDFGQWLVLMITLSFWQLMFVYSSMLLPSAWVIAAQPPPPARLVPAWRDALRPLLWLIPYTVYAVAALVVLYMSSGIASTATGTSPDSLQLRRVHDP